MKTVLVFVHGFMGSSKSFLGFPQDIANTLDADVRMFEYDTKGEYREKTRALKEYLLQLEHSRIFILAHSMGGLISVDAAPEVPNVKGVLTFDSPFFGLNSLLIESGLNRAKEAVDTVSSYLPKTGGWGWLALGVAAVGAFTASQPQVRETLSTTLKSHSEEWYDRFQFLGPLWQIPSMETRFSILPQASFQFHGIYIRLGNGQHFTVPPSSQLQQHFSPYELKAKDTIEAHMNMFDSSLDPSAYTELITKTLTLLSSW